MKASFKKIMFAGLMVTLLAGCKKTTEEPVAREYYDYVNEEAVALATGGSEVSYASLNYAEKTKILGLLEQYAVKNNLTGLTLYENGGYVMYNPRITKGANTYIPGYGFGNIREGEITADLAGESNAAWKQYYHDFETEDPQSINYMDDKGSVVGDLVGFVSDGYWGTGMNAAKNGYDWVNSLAKEKPQPVNADANGMATKYKFEVKVGNELKYTTLTSKSNLAAFNNRPVELEDYLTPFKMLHTQKNGMARGAENLSGASSIKGIANFYNQTKDGYNQEAWDNVGIKATNEGGKNYLSVEFNNATTPFYAMYYLASSLYSPVPQAFIDAIGGVKNYGKFTDGGLTPIDTYLSTGPYTLEAWEKDKQIVFKKNANYDDKDGTIYKIKGLHFNILSAQKTDKEAAFKEFIANKLDAVAIPQTKLDEFKNDPRTTTTVGSTTTKVNLNTCSEEVWEQFFGTNGSITRTNKNEYWKVEAAMSNKNFLDGLSYSLNRKEYAENRGVTPSVNFFGSSYMSDPENGIAYNSTEEHAKAIEHLTKDTDGFGYSLTLAKAKFKQACEELIASGKYKSGDKIEIEIAWQSASAAESDGKDIKQYFESAFNSSGGGLTLEVKNMNVATWTDIYYKKMMVGQYDLGVGGISGNPLNPLNFMEVLKSDNSSGFTLNWSLDTSKADSSLVYDGKTWSYDALWQAADSSVFVNDKGEVAKAESAFFDLAMASSKHQEDGSRVIKFNTAEYEGTKDAPFSVEINNISIGLQVGITDVVTDLSYDYKDNVLTVIVPKDLEEYYYDQENIKLVINFTVTYPDNSKVNTERVVLTQFKK